MDICVQQNIYYKKCPEVSELQHTFPLSNRTSVFLDFFNHRFPVSPVSPYILMKTLQSVPAAAMSPVITDIS